MTTAQKLINQAAGLIGLRTSADPISGADASIFLERLNTLLDAWRIDSLTGYATVKWSGTLPANTQTRTLGPTGQLVTTPITLPRPFRIEDGSTYVAGGVIYPMTEITQAEYEAININPLSSLGPDYYWYNPTLPNGVLNLYPQSAASVTLNLVCLIQVSTFATLTTDLTLPPGYERALAFTLAEEAASDFERTVPPYVMQTAKNARRALKLANFEVPQLNVCEPVPSRYARFVAGG